MGSWLDTEAVTPALDSEESEKNLTHRKLRDEEMGAGTDEPQ